MWEKKGVKEHTQRMKERRRRAKTIQAKGLFWTVYQEMLAKEEAHGPLCLWHHDDLWAQWVIGERQPIWLPRLRSREQIAKDMLFFMSIERKANPRLRVMS